MLDHLSLQGQYDFKLVALSCAIAVFASFASLNLAERIRSSSGGARLLWLTGSAFALGGGIWSMHFVAMLAFSMPVTISYEFWWTLGSMLLAVLATAGGYALIAFGSLQPSRLLLAGVVTGTGVAVMHYAGMSAMVMQATIAYDRALFLLSIAIAITAATVALWLSFRLEGAWHKLGASIVMGAAIAGMHFTGMGAASFALCLTNDPTSAGIDAQLLAVAIAGATFVILSLGLSSALFDQRMARRATVDAEKLMRNERRYRSLVSNSSDIIAVLDAEGRITYESPSAKRILGYDSAALLGRPLTDFVIAEDDVVARSLIERLRGSRKPEAGSDDAARIKGEIRCRNVGGETIDLEFVGINMLDDADIGGLVLNLRDITERNRVAAELRAAKARAESANQSKTQFLANISHELRTPLNAIIGFSDIIRRTDGEAGEYATHIADAGRRLLTVVSDVLDMSRLESGGLILDRRECRIDEVLEIAVENARPLFDAKQQPLDLRIEPGIADIAADGKRLAQLFANLLSNASKFTPERGRVLVMAKPLKKGVTIAIADTGIGMTHEQIVLACKPFGQVQGHLARTQEGAGLGLPIARGLTRQHGGELHIESRPGQGTTVVLTLPPGAAP
ncbi:MAG TPA: MHYT domain-containing protein [Dongiaceae bacterium]